MVRVVSQNFSPPRSRHSSGETDWDLAERADSALSALGKKRCELGISDFESSSDSFWDSEFDLEHPEEINTQYGFVNDDVNGNEFSVKSDVHSRRKERRRERNKLSAQAYRKRKRQITCKQQQELFVLEEKNKHLLLHVNRLEKKIEKAKMCLRGISVTTPDDPPKDTVESTLKNITLQTSLPNVFALQETTDKDHQLNLNINKKLYHQSAAVQIHQNVGPTADGAIARDTYDPSDILHENNGSITPILINANTIIGANNNTKTNSHPARVAFRSLVSAKSKHGYCNANMNYKSPILRPSTLQTVPEVPLCFLGELDGNTMPIQSSSEKSKGNALCKDEKLPCHTLKMSLTNKNINLNNTKFDCANDNFRQRNSDNCDNHVQINSFQLMNINGNLNQSAIASQHEIYP